MIEKLNILKRWHDQTQGELDFARSMRDQWQREVDRLEGKPPTVPDGEVYFRDPWTGQAFGKIVNLD